MLPMKKSPPGRIAGSLGLFGLLLTAALAQSVEPAGGLDRVTALLQSGKEPVRIVCFGDSITGVYYHTGGRRAWCDMLGIALGRVFPGAKLEMFNAGVSGNTTTQGLARREKDVLAHRPHLVVVMFGINDVVRTPREQFEANLKSIVRRCRDSGAAVALCTPNSVYANPGRPMERLADYAQIVRQVAVASSVPLADCYAAYEQVRANDPLAWKLLMSETIHPSMNGHRLFAEVIAQAVGGRRVSLDDVAPLDDALRFTLKRLRAGQPVSVIASPPYDRIVPDALRRLYHEAKIEATPWPVEGRSLAQMEQWAKDIRRKAPHLVVVAVPATAGAENDEAFIRSYAWVLNWSVDFGRQTWDRMVVLPSVAGPLRPGEKRFEDVARRIVVGADASYLERRPDDERPAAEIVREWIERQASTIKPD